MLQRFIASIDRLSDHLSPYTVLFLRRWFRFNQIWLLILFAYSLFIVTGVIGYVFSDTVERIGSSYYATSYLLMPAFVVQWLGLGVFSQSATWYNYWSTKWTDPLMFLTPMSDREIYFGFRWIDLLVDVSLFSMLMPLFAILYYNRVISLEWAVVYPVAFLVGILTLGNISFSVSLASNKVYHAILLAILWLAILVLLVTGSFAMSLMALRFSGVPGHYSLLQTAVFFLFIASAPRWPVFLLGILLYNLAAWKLCGYNLVEARPFVQKLGVSLGVYMSITLFLLTVWVSIYLLSPV